MKILLVLFLTLVSCSHQVEKMPETTKEQMSVLNNKSEVPPSLLKLVEIKEKESIEYQIAAHQAAMDLLSLGKSSLDGLDSGHALRLLSVGAKLLPWRSDIAQLRNVARDRYIAGINSLLDEGQVQCAIIIERMKYLSSIAPDGILKIKKFNQICPNNELQFTKKYELENNDLIALLKDKIPETSKDNVPSNDSDLSLQLDAIIKRNKTFPSLDLLILGFNVYYKKYINQSKVIYDQFKISPNADDENHFELTALKKLNPDEDDKKTPVSPFSSFFRPIDRSDEDETQKKLKTYSPLDQARIEYCAFLLEAIGNRFNGGEVIDFDQPFPADTEYFPCRVNDDLNIYDSTTMILRKKYFEFFMQRPEVRDDKNRPTNAHFSYDDFTPKYVITRTSFNYKDRSEPVYYIGTPRRQKSFTIDGDRELIKGILSITYEIDFYHTFLMYQDVLSKKEKSFSSWWKKTSLPKSQEEFPVPDDGSSRNGNWW